MNVQNFLTEVAVLAAGGIIAMSGAYYLLKDDVMKYFRQKKEVALNDEKSQLLPLRLQAHERLLLYIERINPSNLFLRVHHKGISLADLHANLLEEIRSEYQHNVTQQLYVSTETWDVVRKLKDDTLAMINSATRDLPGDARGVDLSKKVLQHLANMSENPYELTINIIKSDVHKLF